MNKKQEKTKREQERHRKRKAEKEIKKEREKERVRKRETKRELERERQREKGDHWSQPPPPKKKMQRLCSTFVEFSSDLNRMVERVIQLMLLFVFFSVPSFEVGNSKGGQQPISSRAIVKPPKYTAEWLRDDCSSLEVGLQLPWLTKQVRETRTTF